MNPEDVKSPREKYLAAYLHAPPAARDPHGVVGGVSKRILTPHPRVFQ